MLSSLLGSLLGLGGGTGVGSTLTDLLGGLLGLGTGGTGSSASG